MKRALTGKGAHWDTAAGRGPGHQLSPPKAMQIQHSVVTGQCGTVQFILIRHKRGHQARLECATAGELPLLADPVCLERK